jgi:hypothetical protein
MRHSMWDTTTMRSMGEPIDVRAVSEMMSSVRLVRWESHKAKRRRNDTVQEKA